MLSAIALLALIVEAPQNAPRTDTAAASMPAVRARPVPPVNWVRPDDFPKEIVAPGQSLEASVKLEVDAAGGIAACTVMKPSGSPAYDEKVCQLVSARGRYVPAQSADGKAMPAISFLRFRLSGD